MFLGDMHWPQFTDAWINSSSFDLQRSDWFCTWSYQICSRGSRSSCLCSVALGQESRGSWRCCSLLLIYQDSRRESHSHQLSSLHTGCRFRRCTISVLLRFCVRRDLHDQPGNQTACQKAKKKFVKISTWTKRQCRFATGMICTFRIKPQAP